jgi:chorismate-pyruvate lyase
MGDRVSYTRQDLRPASIGKLDPDTLHPRARALIFLPDLVTDYIEAAFIEPIAVTCLSQETQSDLSISALEVDPGDRVVVRQSLIHGATTNRPFIHAEVHLVVSRVPAGLIRDLRDSTAGLGRLLDTHQVEHNREMLWYGADTSNDLTAVLEGDTFAARRYRLVDAGVPLVTIVERFAVDLFGD